MPAAMLKCRLDQLIFVHFLHTGKSYPKHLIRSAKDTKGASARSGQPVNLA